MERFGVFGFLEVIARISVGEMPVLGWDSGRVLCVFCICPTCFLTFLLVVLLVNLISKLTVRSVRLLMSLISLPFLISFEWFSLD